MLSFRVSHFRYEQKLEKNSSIIDNLRTHLADLQAEIKSEKEKSLAQQ